MRIAIIGPGIMDIPSKGWGAVESIIYNYYLELKKLGHDVSIFNNPNLTEVISQINEQSFDIVHCQYDNHVLELNNKLNKRFIATSHYGWILQRHIWDPGYHAIFRAMLESPGILALSPEIENVYRMGGFTGWLRSLRNGCECSRFAFKTEGKPRAICLGKVEPRKLQAAVAAAYPHLPIDFVGPCVDPNFQNHISPANRTKYLGSWTKQEVYDYLTNYSCLVLLSAGEAAPLVVPEALAAGLSVVISEESAANMPRNLPFIRVINLKDNNRDDIELEIQEAIAHNSKYRNDIREFAQTHFDWSVIVKEYVDIVEGFL